jgi:hypothetical protein
MCRVADSEEKQVVQRASEKRQDEVRSGWLAIRKMVGSDNFYEKSSELPLLGNWRNALEQP